MKKITAEEFLKSKGWAPSMGGDFFKSVAELLDEYATLQPYDPNAPRFPSEKEINDMTELYHNLEGPHGNPDGKIYVYAGINMIQTWMKEHGLLQPNGL